MVCLRDPRLREGHEKSLLIHSVPGSLMNTVGILECSFKTFFYPNDPIKLQPRAVMSKQLFFVEAKVTLRENARSETDPAVQQRPALA